MPVFDSSQEKPIEGAEEESLSAMNLSTGIQTLEQWEALPIQKRRMHLAGGDVPKELQYISPEESADPEIATFADLLNKRMDELCNTNHRQGYDEHEPKGDPVREVSLLLLPDGTPLGGHISIWQEGEPSDEGACEDVSWSASGYFHHDGEPISVDECLFWSGY